MQVQSRGVEVAGPLAPADPGGARERVLDQRVDVVEQGGAAEAGGEQRAAAAARAASSAGVRFWIGCGVQTMAGSKPSAPAWAAAACLNSTVAVAQPGMPRTSRAWMSCKLHDVHDPQSARASTTISAEATMS